MDASLKNEIRAAVREVVQEEIQVAAEAAKQEIKATSAETKKKSSKPKTELDQTRQTGVDTRDPRARTSQWPCFGSHEAKNHGNRFGVWTECSRCGLRLNYVPAVNAPAQTTHVDLPQNVTLALERLRTDGWEAAEITATQVKATITIVSKEYQVRKPKAKGYKPNDVMKMEAAKGKGKSPAEDHNMAKATEIADSDSEFEKVEDKGKKREKAQPSLQETK